MLLGELTKSFANTWEWPWNTVRIPAWTTTPTWLFLWIRRGHFSKYMGKCSGNLWLNSLIVLPYVILIVATLWSNYYHPTCKLKHRVITWFVQGHTARKERAEICTKTDSNLKYHKEPLCYSFSVSLLLRPTGSFHIAWWFCFGKLDIWTADVRIFASGFQRDIFQLEPRVCICAQWGRINDDINWKHRWLWNQLPFKLQGYWVNELILEGCVSFLESWERKLNINPVHIYNAQFIAKCRLDQMVETFFHSLRLFYVGWPTYSRSFNWLVWSK